MSQEDTNKLIGRLEKGVEMLEKGIDHVQEKQQIGNETLLKAIGEMRLEFKDEMLKMHDQLDKRTTILHTQIDGITNKQTDLRLSVQKLAGTVSVIVGVGLYIVKGVFDAARDAFASTFLGN